jgi:phytoene dehydrogenase-like protein
MGETNGKKGIWGYVRGGMGGLSNAIARSAEDLGAEIVTDAEVTSIWIEDGKAKGVILKDGTKIEATKTVSNLDCRQTFEKLMDSSILPKDFEHSVKRMQYDSASMKINVTLSELPNFNAIPGTKPGPQHRGTIHICPSCETMERAFDDAKYGLPSKRPILECTIPSVVDDTIAPKGKHLMNMFIQYAPYHLKKGTWDDYRDDFADRCFDIMNEYAPNFKKSVIER